MEGLKKTYRACVESVIVRYLAVGGTLALFEVGFLYLLVHVGYLHYLLAGAISSIVALVIRFLLQKYITFANRENENRIVGRQFALYVLLCALSFGLNLVFLYTFSTILGLWYVASSVLSIICIAFISFFVYRFIFSSQQ
jgi:putative flippase GtrA